MEVARTRVRRYKPKGSNLWVVCIHESAGSSHRTFALTSVRQVVLGVGLDIAGFAVVAWDKNLESLAYLANLDGKIPNALIPDYVRNLLLAEKIEDWTVARVGNMFGYVPDPDV